MNKWLILNATEIVKTPSDIIFRLDVQNEVAPGTSNITILHLKL